MGALIRDAERMMDHLRVRDAVLVGLSIGGMIGRGLAVKRLDLIRGLALSNTAAKIGTAEIWAARIKAVRAGGMEAIADSAMARWFSRAFRVGPAFDAQRARFLAQRPEGWAGCAAAIAGTDVCNTTASLTLPTLCLAGSADGATPPGSGQGNRRPDQGKPVRADPGRGSPAAHRPAGCLRRGAGRLSGQYRACLNRTF
jgi:3-oxoadipate enol-lactonase